MFQSALVATVTSDTFGVCHFRGLFRAVGGFGFAACRRAFAVFGVLGVFSGVFGFFSFAVASWN